VKTLFINIAIAISSLSFIACNSNTSQTETVAEDSVADSNNSTSQAGPTTEIVNSYVKIKNALTQDNDKDAASAGSDMVKAFANFNKSTLSEENSKLFAEIEGTAREHAEHIIANAGNIKHQREHFEMLSKDVYDLVKGIGSDQKLYWDHCPMYNNNKGADWLSETKEISNPYLGKAMPDCGTVKEELNL
jgi:hypothetical protein